LIGAGDELEPLRQQAQELGIEEMVRFAGTRANVPNPNHLFDVSVLCSRSEGFPNTLVEAMAAARPVVATAVGGVPDAVREGDTGLLVPPRQPVALAESLGRLLESESMRAQFGAAGLREARARYTAAAVVPRLVGLYRRLLNRPHTQETNAAA
jgi:glycosyltransferase involved in cell wall biosynthesis